MSSNRQLPPRRNRLRLSNWTSVTDSRILDLRRGDYDDNRTSPHGGNVGNLVVAAALEFNYLKAAIGFLTLVIVPALLVGIVPSLIITYSRMKLGLVSEHNRIGAFIILVVLAGLVLWLGRPFLSKAAESFWHL